jgi:hypothetical protein
MRLNGENAQLETGGDLTALHAGPDELKDIAFTFC